MMSAGFQWGHVPTTDVTEHKHLGNKHKRRRDDETYTSSYSVSSIGKRSRTEKISGQRLPVSRLIEVLDHNSVKSLISDLLILHPEIENSISKIAKRPSKKESIKLLQSKLDDITSNLPYKYDLNSDYSYLRVKPFILEFLNTTSDFILNFIPPIESDITTSLNFLSTTTSLFNDLPPFSSSEFNYIKSTAYEQLANTWLLCLTLPDENIESLTSLIKMVDQLDLLNQLTQFNTHSSGKFDHVLHYLKSQLDQFDKLNSMGTTNSVLDMINVDYSNYSMVGKTS